MNIILDIICAILGFFDCFWCYFGYHQWGEDTNKRNRPSDQTEGKGWIFFMPLPVLFLSYAFGPPQVVDRTCLRCRKTRTFDI